MREQLLEEKKAQILEDLVCWAKEKEILCPGEQLVFTLGITEIRTVVEGEAGVEPKSSSMLDLTVEEFFTIDRIRATGCPGTLPTRIHNAIAREEGPDCSMRDFLKKYRSEEQRLLCITNMGKVMVPYVIQMLKEFPAR